MGHGSLSTHPSSGAGTATALVEPPAHPTIEDITRAQFVLRSLIHRTPLMSSQTLARACGATVYLKAEMLQRTGTFKVRGAFYRILRLSANERARGVVAVSGGNHAQGVALAASSLGISAVIVMPDAAPELKKRATQSYLRPVSTSRVETKDAEGRPLASFADANIRAREIQAQEGRVLIHAYDDCDVMTGQGTIGLEILSDWPDVDMIVVPIGGGGLISGIATAVKALKPSICIVGVQTSLMPSMVKSLAQGSPVEPLPRVDTIADGININSPSRDTLSIVSRLVDKVVTVEEDEIKRAIRFLFQRAKLVVEGAGATGVAALLSQKLNMSGKRVVLLLSGGNIGMQQFREIVNLPDPTAEEIW